MGLYRYLLLFRNLLHYQFEIVFITLYHKFVDFYNSIDSYLFLSQFLILLHNLSVVLHLKSTKHRHSHIRSDFVCWKLNIVFVIMWQNIAYRFPFNYVVVSKFSIDFSAFFIPWKNRNDECAIFKNTTEHAVELLKSE